MSQAKDTLLRLFVLLHLNPTEPHTIATTNLDKASRLRLFSHAALNPAEIEPPVIAPPLVLHP